MNRYGQLLAAALPTVITTESQYDRLRTTVEALMSRDEDDLSAEEVKLLDLRHLNRSVRRDALCD